MHSKNSSRIQALVLRTLFVPILVCLTAMFFVPAALAQSPIDGFDPDANGYVNTLAVQADGKILVGGYFT